MKRTPLFLFSVLLTACSARTTPSPIPAPTQAPQPTITNNQLPMPTTIPSLGSPISTSPILASPIPRLNPANWKDWPVIPISTDPSLKKVYEFGLSLGNDPHAFSIFGDCQERPEVFFGAFETDSTLFASLSPELQNTVDNFRGSFNRESPTAQDGTTPGALLWTQWHQGNFGCSF